MTTATQPCHDLRRFYVGSRTSHVTRHQLASVIRGAIDEPIHNQLDHASGSQHSSQHPKKAYLFSGLPMIVDLQRFCASLKAGLPVLAPRAAYAKLISNSE